MKISNHICEFQQNFASIMKASIHLRNHIKFLIIIVKDLKKYINFHTFTQETYKFSKHYSKIHEKVYKYLYIYSRNIQIF